MALNADNLRFLLLALSSGVRFERALMIGRQELALGYEELAANAARLRRILAAGGIDLSIEHTRRLLEDEEGFAEPLMRLLGAAHVDSMDISQYEGATIIHDLNQPIPTSLRNRYSVVIDSGSLEHVFNVAEAFRNCLTMVEDGGHFITIGPGNNAMGHGFYQFGPELYFRVLSPQNGFHIKYMVAKQMREAAPWYAVMDPAVIGRRVEWQPLAETQLMVLAQKERTIEIFNPVPQQSDYLSHWSTIAPVANQVHHHVASGSTMPQPVSFRRLALRWAPLRIKTAYRRFKEVARVLGQPDPACFTRLDKPQLRE